jgi:hypothetical protein
MKLNTLASRKEKQLFALELKAAIDRMHDRQHGAKSPQLRSLKRQLKKLDNNL